PALLTSLLTTALISTAAAHADTKITNLLDLTAPDFQVLLSKAKRAVEGRDDFKGIFAGDDSVKFTADRAASDSYSTTVKFKRTYKDLEVIGEDAIVHFNKNGEIHDVAGKTQTFDLDAAPKLALDTAQKLLDDRAGEPVALTEAARLKVLKDASGR